MEVWNLCVDCIYGGKELFEYMKGCQDHRQPAEWVAHLQLSLHQLNSTISQIRHKAALYLFRLTALQHPFARSVLMVWRVLHARM